MGVNLLSWKRIQKLNADLGERFVHVALWSHGDYWLWLCVRHDGSTAQYNTRTGELIDPDPEDAETSTVLLLRTRDTTWHGEDWLSELDRRAEELELGVTNLVHGS